MLPFLHYFFVIMCMTWLGWLVSLPSAHSSGLSGPPVLWLGSSLKASPSDFLLCSGDITNFSPWIFILQATLVMPPFIRCSC